MRLIVQQPCWVAMVKPVADGATENAGVENAAPDCRGGKPGSGNRGSLKSMESEDFKNVFPTVLTELGSMSGQKLKA